MFRQFLNRAFQASRRAPTQAFVRNFATQAVRNSSFKKWACAAALGGAAVYTMLPSASAAESLPISGLPGTKNERTFIAVKPDGVQRGIVGEIIKRFETKGYKLVALKLIHPTEDFAKQHYSDLSTKPFFAGLVKFFSSGPVVAMVWEGRGVVSGGRRLLGATNPDDSPPGSIRGDLCVNIGRNICHGSDSTDAAKDEIELWFKQGEVLNWDKADTAWVNEK
eukprot:TRINITY_DN18089_c0_g1_i1.p1 TRINITY_DN18089_c0_g1~~TRINITY_DN18089_c0_g1_i1.p1  ORF type:complete len:239 (-),score=41.37 TRINITY_DN18089_c0_g1_i1:75-740(-)